MKNLDALTLNGSPGFTIRRASTADAAGIAAVLQAVAAERIYSAIDQVWSVDDQRQYIETRSDREAIYIAVIDGEIVGYQ